MEYMDRRQFFGLSVVAASRLLFSDLDTPSLALAQDLNLVNELNTSVAPNYLTIDTFDCVGMSSNQIEMALQSIAQKEAQQFVESDISTAESMGILRVRPKYDTVYDKPVAKSSGYRDVSGQPAGGYSFKSPGGSISVSYTGGANISLSFGCPLPWGTVSIACSFGRSNGIGVESMAQFIPGDGHSYKVTLNNKYNVLPYTVYYTNASGVRSVYAHKVSSPVIVGYAFGYRKVK